MPCESDRLHRLSRREFLTSLFAAWSGAGCSGFADGLATDDTSGADTTFPPSVPPYESAFLNWSQELDFPDLRAFTPRTETDLVDVANWCARNGFVLRPRGAMHNWSPLAL
ncbi:MAG: cholesterol oxidase substrate-binding domain-containing protein, partial [Panacagrimonas sp.]